MSNQEFSTGLAKITDTFAPMIERQLTGNGVQMDGYSKQCVVSAISSINAVLDTQGITWTDPALDKNNVTQILLSVASLKLNASASPREVYFQVRNVKTKAKDEHGKEIWKKQIEMGIEGDGNDAILARFGRDIEKVGQFWLVRDGDDFVYPTYDGFDLTPPKWTPKGKGDVVRVVYPLKKRDGSVEFHIAERDDVVKNLIAHLNNNLMNQTFGLAKDRYSATADEKKKIDTRKAELLKKAKELGLAALDDDNLAQYISPAWTDPQSRESMIIRKMRNNIVKKIPKDFGNAFIEMTYNETADETAASVRREINENANKEVIDIKPESVTEVKPETEQPKQPADPEPKQEPVEKQAEIPFDEQTAGSSRNPGF